MTAPAAPTIKVRSNGPSLRVLWRPVADAATYKLYSDPTTGPTTVAATINASAVGSDGWFQHTYTPVGSPVFTTLAAVNAGAEESEPSNEVRSIPSSYYSATVGQKVSDRSESVVIASDQTAVPVSLDTALSSAVDSVAAVVSGDVAHDAADSGNPVKIGGKAGAVPAAVASGDRVNASYDTYGRQRVTIGAGAVDTTVAEDYTGDGSANGNYKLGVVANLAALSGADASKFDRWRNNGGALSVLASAARTASVDSADMTNWNWRGGHIVIDVTAVAATPSIVVTVQGKDNVSGKYYTILASAAITGTGTTVLRVYPGVAAVANLAISDVLPRTWRVSVVAADADSITYSVGASQVL
jgi:hypothetical protein